MSKRARQRRQAITDPAWVEIDGVTIPAITVDFRVRKGISLIGEFQFPPGRHPVLLSVTITADDLLATEGVTPDDLAQGVISAARARADHQLRTYAKEHPEWQHPALPEMTLSPGPGRRRILPETLARLARDYARLHEQRPDDFEHFNGSYDYLSNQPRWRHYAAGSIKNLVSRCSTEGWLDLSTRRETDQTTTLLRDLGERD